MLGAVTLDCRVYQEVKADHHATAQALGVVALASLGAGLGWVGVGPGRFLAMALLTLVAIAGCMARILLTYGIGTRWFPEPQTRADLGTLVRTLGFAQTPGIFRVLALVPGLGLPVTVVTAIWTLATMVVAVRVALDYTSALRALGVCLIGWGLPLAIVVIVGVFFASPVS